MDKVRIGVVGAGGMGQGHCEYMHELDVGELTAVCDIVPEVAKEVGGEHKVPYFLKHTDLMDSGLVDAVLIATPHYDHPPIAIDAFKRGLHVLSEKPIGVSVKEASRMIRAAERSGKAFAVMFQLRHAPEYQAARKLLDAGRLGEIRRVSMTMAYYRSQAYYDSGGWRATWDGEGGGVLLNQAPHGLDIFTWLGGVPKLVTGQTRTLMHDIDVEDEAFAVLEYANGAHGYVYAGVNDSPQVSRLEICGDKGKILIESTDWREEGIRFWEIKPPLSRFTVENTEMWAAPEAKLVEVPLRKREQGHIAVTRNFCRAILYGEELVTPGAEGIWSLELANAMILSHYRKKTVRIPVKRNEYEELLEGLRAKSKPKKGIRDRRITDTQFTGKGKK
ncbi:MAG: Gfo/Idh/MocA family oxidoreductase [Armatimonadota bacterium]|nr:MAG: Gfo/Idh/MocA family oxidoreductase [Armatimonadota bacterium]